MYYTTLRAWRQGLFLGNSEDGILAGLAQARDGKLFEGERVTECGLQNITIAGHAGSSFNALHAVNAREVGEETLDLRMLESSFVGFSHVYIIAQVWG